MTLRSNSTKQQTGQKRSYRQKMIDNKTLREKKLEMVYLN